MRVARTGFVVAVICGLLGLPSALGLSGEAFGSDRFLLFVTAEAPSSGLVASAYRAGQSVEATALPEAARSRLGRAFPRLFAAGKTSTRAALEGEVKAARDAHYHANFDVAEQHFKVAVDLAYAEPELVSESARLLQQLADAAAVRYRNTVARGRPETEARAELTTFVRRFLTVMPNSADHPPEVLAEWDAARQAALADPGLLSVSVQPLELERSGSCHLFVNGGEVGALPLPGPVRVARGDHLVQVQCGLQKSWLHQVKVDEKRVSLIVPVRAMVAARADPDTGGIVLVAAEEGDESALVSAVSDATGFQGAVVVRTVVRGIEIGRHDAGTTGASREATAALIDGTIGAVRTVDRQGPSSGPGAWPWVLVGVGVVGVAAGGIMDGLYLGKNDAERSDAQGLVAGGITSFVVGGVALASGVVWLIVEATSDSSDKAARAHRPIAVSPGGVAVRF